MTIVCESCARSANHIFYDGERGRATSVRMENIFPIDVSHGRLDSLWRHQTLLVVDSFVGRLGRLLGFEDHSEKCYVPVECGHWYHVVRFHVVAKFTCNDYLLREKRLTDDNHVGVDGSVGCLGIARARLIHYFAGHGVEAGSRTLKIEIAVYTGTREIANWTPPIPYKGCSQGPKFGTYSDWGFWAFCY